MCTTSQSMTYPITLVMGGNLKPYILVIVSIDLGPILSLVQCSSSADGCRQTADSPLKTGVPSSKRSPIHTMEGCCSPNGWNIHTECVELGCMILLLSISAHSWLPMGAYQTKKDTIFWFPLRRCATPTFSWLPRACHVSMLAHSLALFPTVDPSTGSKGNPVKATTTVRWQLDNRQYEILAPELNRNRRLLWDVVGRRVNFPKLVWKWLKEISWVHF